MGVVDLNGIRLRNRLVTSASLLGYGASKRRLILYGLSPDRPVGAAGPVRRGHHADDDARAARGPLHAPRGLGRHRVPGDAPAVRARRCAGSTPAGSTPSAGRTSASSATSTSTSTAPPTSTGSSRIGGFSADEIVQLVETVNERAKPGEIAAIELNVSCHNVNFPFETILEESLARAVPRSRHPVILKVSPDEDYRWQARLAERHGCAAITAINTVKGLRLDPETGEPWLKNRYGAVSGPAIKPIGLRVVAELRDAGHPAADHRQRRHPRLRRLPRVLLGRRRRRQPRVRGLAPADAALRPGTGRGPADPAADLAGRRLHAARRRPALAAGGGARRPRHPSRPASRSRRRSSPRDHPGIAIEARAPRRLRFLPNPKQMTTRQGDRRAEPDSA